MNEIKIVVKGTNESAPATRAAKEGIDAIGKSAEKTTNSLQKEERELSQVERQMASLAVEAKALSLSFDNAGTSTEKTTNKVSRSRDEFGKFKKDMGGLAKEVDSGFEGIFGNAGKGFSNMVKDAANTGKQIGQALAKEAKGAFEGSGIMEKAGSAISNPVSGPAILGSLVAVLPAVGTLIGATIQTAASGGFLAAGLLIAAKDSRAQSAIAGLKRDIGDELKGVSAPFVDEMIGATKIIDDAFQQSAPGLKETFAAIAPEVKDLATSVGSAWNELAPGLEEAVRASGPVMHEFGNGLKLIGKATGDMFHDIAAGGPGAAATFHGLFVSVATLIEALGLAIKTAGILFDIQLHPQNTLKDLQSFNDLNASAAGFGHALGDASTAADGFSSSSSDAGDSAAGMADQTWTAADALAALNTQFDTAISRALELQNETADNTIAMDQLAQSFKENGRTIDANTVKGAKNVQVIDGIIASLERNRQAAIAAGDGSQAATDAANASYNTQLGKLQQVIAKLLGSASAAKAFMDQFYNKDVVISVNVRYIQTGSVSAQGVVSGGMPHRSGAEIAMAHGGVAGAASGGLRTGMTWVGENGPEIMDLSGMAGAMIHTAGDSKRIAAGAGGYGNSNKMTVVMHVRAGDNTARTAQLIEDIRDYVTIQGGDGTVLGIH